ncbi:MAG: ATP-binding protein [Oscillospiraceae bacterium]|nr:ATP-binding protein [Oscillospiraceae bacterium]
MYRPEIVMQAKQRLAQQKAEKESQYHQHLQQAYAQLPRLKEIDMQLRRTMTLAAQTVFTQGGDPVAAMEQVKQENLALQRERKELIEKNFAPGYLDESPVCPHCGGSGYVGSTMCRCLKTLCAQGQKASLYQLTTGAERFENFRLDYYPERFDSNVGATPRVVMGRNFETCKQYAAAFEKGIGNLLFVGGTGLGKTYLSACIANVVTERGYSVSYESAPQLFAKLEKNRFNPDEESQSEADYFAACDLLIIDDLGTEMPGNFVTAALYGLLNQRLLDGKSMIISTNLNNIEIAQRYSPQIASRVLGNFKNMVFLGEDIRILKNRGI